MKVILLNIVESNLTKKRNSSFWAIGICLIHPQKESESWNIVGKRENGNVFVLLMLHIFFIEKLEDRTFIFIVICILNSSQIQIRSFLQTIQIQVSQVVTICLTWNQNCFPLSYTNILNVLLHEKYNRPYLTMEWSTLEISALK